MKVTVDGYTLSVGERAKVNVPTPWGGWKVKGVPIGTIVRGHVQMRDGEPVGKAIGQMQTPILNS